MHIYLLQIGRFRQHILSISRAKYGCSRKKITIPTADNNIKFINKNITLLMLMFISLNRTIDWTTDSKISKKYFNKYCVVLEIIGSFPLSAKCFHFPVHWTFILFRSHIPFSLTARPFYNLNLGLQFILVFVYLLTYFNYSFIFFRKKKFFHNICINKNFQSNYIQVFI